MGTTPDTSAHPASRLVAVAAVASLLWSLVTVVTAVTALPADASPASVECDRLVWSAFDAHTRNEQIHAADADGGGRQVISVVGADPVAIGNRYPLWSPDGSQVAWSGSDRIFVADADGAGRRDISGVRVGGLGPRWSPDGTRISWVDDGDLYVASADGTNRRVISSVGSGPDPLWSPDGSRLAFTALFYGVFVDNADGTGRTEISTVGPDPDPTFNRDLRWSPDGSRLAWSGTDGTTVEAERRIWSANADGTDRRMLSSVGPDPDPTENYSPEWSPDGTQIAWSAREGVYVARADGTDRREISRGSRPRWSPDGTRLAWMGLPDGIEPFPWDPGAQVFVSGVDGSNPVQVSGETRVGTPEWSPDGTRVAYAAITDPSQLAAGPDLYVATVDGEARSPISTVGPDPDPSSNRDPQWRTHPYSDIRTSFAAADVHLLCTLGITSGITATTYGPALAVTREQTSAFLARLYRTITNKTCGSDPRQFTDVATSFARNDIGCILDLGVTSGTTPTTYSPGDPVTREQMAALLARLYRTISGQACGSDPTQFTDVATSFARNDIGCILDLGITGGTTPTTYSPGDPVTREQMAAFLARLYRVLTA